MTGLLLADAEIDGGPRLDVRITDHRIAELGHRLERRAGERVVEGGGGALLPGLCDHHLHLHALTAHRRSVLCGPPQVTDRARLSAALRDAAPDQHGWIRGVGYVETVAGELDAAALDRLGPPHPVRVQHRSGALWTLNTAALTATGLATADHPGIERDDHGNPTGRLWRADDWLRARLPPATPLPLGEVTRELAGFGITAVTDATPDLDAQALASFDRAVRDGTLPQRLHLLGAPLEAPATDPRITTGPHKIVIADSSLPDLGDLTERIRTAHAHERPVAVHCVTREALLLLLAALDEAGPPVDGDRVEHAALIPAEIIENMRRRGLRVVTQPGFIADRGDDYLRDVPAEEHRDLYRHRSLRAAGIPVALSSDAPYGPLDPWQVMNAAVHRRTRSGTIAGPPERLDPLAALHAYLTPPEAPGGVIKRIRTGATADLVLLHTPLAEALRRPSAALVRTVLIGGHLVL
ncbi:amidohydrolase family protein [Actinomadura madurae]|uniref:amidohydrolase family protein n=1 Tax=Actinomadura madurae TaxID=1993 RepID=UPI0020D22474|nr:amidohydrolase family protein [Actinomadura madurae]MCP9948319.1 amidohydrolase family protein [Actinomadura madurae]MCP9965092.1 amidohydrolase family protein [Actinomadura madurae]MCP9977584.1 amidohydrolase family protein [Actinomadura madurae]MCQ0010919.1 amidohydrolase family protein [Actinomadura madurae]MCQ0013770.1 amidohydrolase family protein [Actinomadura madurae]